MLLSSLIGSSPDLLSVYQGGRRIQAPEQSESVSRIQEALVLLGYDLPASGVDGVFGNETASAVSAFKARKGLQPTDPVIGVGTITKLDLEIAYIENVPNILDLTSVDDITLSNDPLFGGTLASSYPQLAILQRILDAFKPSNEFCFPVGPTFGSSLASKIGKYVEPFFQVDYCKVCPKCLGFDFFDLQETSDVYAFFIETHNPSAGSDAIAKVAQSKRPDILRHRQDQPEWYEIKPNSWSGLKDFREKQKALLKIYSENSLPYRPGEKYTPSKRISLGSFIADNVNKLEIAIETGKPEPGYINYRFCVRGDYVEYFERVGLIAGILSIVAALMPEILFAPALALAQRYAVLALAALKPLAFPNT
jgi:hypothetical protein